MKVLLFSLITGLFFLAQGFKINRNPNPGRFLMQQQKKLILLSRLLNRFLRVRLCGTSIVLPVTAKREWETVPRRPS